MPSKNLHPLWVTVLTLLLVAAIAVTDNRTSHEVSLSIFLLIPVSIAVYYGNLAAGIAVAVISATAWYYNDVSAPIPHSHWLIPVWNSLMRLGYFILHSFFMHRSLKLLAENKRLANTDPLTGTFNRRYFDQFISTLPDGYPVTLAYFDLDNFKALNDVKGHDEGDRVLKVFAGIVMSRLGARDCFARLGGDEFALVLVGDHGLNGKIILEKICEDSISAFAAERWAVGVSTGAITKTGPGIALNQLISQADALMYQVKRTEKGRFLHRFCSDSSS